MGTGSCNGGNGEVLREIGQHFNYLEFRGHLSLYHIYPSEAEWRHRHLACAGCNKGLHRYTENNLGK